MPTKYSPDEQKSAGESSEVELVAAIHLLLGGALQKPFRFSGGLIKKISRQ